MINRWNAPLCVLVLALAASVARAGQAATPIAHAEVRGEGPVKLVLLSSSPVDWRVWEPFMERNASRYTMHALSLPGVGGGPAPAPRARWKPKDREDRVNAPLDTPMLDNAVLAVADYLREHDLGRPVVMGLGVGGMVALRLGMEHESLVSKVITVEGHAAFPIHKPMSPKQRAEHVLLTSQPNFWAVDEASWDAQVAEWITLSEPDAAVAARVGECSADTPREVAIDYMVEQQLADLSVSLHKLRVPTLAVFSAAFDSNPNLLDQVRRGFQPAWACDVRLYPGRSYFFCMKADEDFERDVAEFIAAAPGGK